MRRADSHERFLTRSMAVAWALYALFAITFAQFQITGDALVYFNPLRRFFGEHPDSAFAYQFGSDFWNWPFFLVGKLLGTIFGQEPHTFHVSFEEISITVAAQAAFVLTIYLGWRMLRELDLPAGPAVLFLATFGSPLFYYVIFDPAMKHAVDTLWITAAAYLLMRIYDGPRDLYAVLLGLLASAAVITRYVDFMFFFFVALSLFAYARHRQLAIATVTAAISGPILFALPALRGISYFTPSYFPHSSAIGRFALGAHPIVAGTHNPLNGFSPLTPVKMLFSDHRGLFVWTPLTLFAVIGFALLLARARHDDRRPFIFTLGGASLALLLGHSIWGFWDGAFSFSTRFLTALFPLVLLGTAELRRRFGRPVYGLLVLCVAWSLVIAFVHNIGYDGINAGDSATTTARQGWHRREGLWVKWKRDGEDRWKYLWALLHGDDPAHVHGP